MKISFLNNKKALKLLILGQGKTAISASKFCDQMKINYKIYAPNKEKNGLLIQGKEILSDQPNIHEIKEYDYIIATPGMPASSKIYRLASASKVAIISDLDLFFSATENKIYSVTGSNGKSTTVKMIELLCKSKSLEIGIGGNYGVPALSLVRQNIPINVIEVSTFQAEFMSYFHSNLCILLNIVENHLDRHKDMKEYIALKEKIFLRSDIGIFNLDDERTREAAKKHTNGVPFSIKDKSNQGYFLERKGDLLLIYYQSQLVAELKIGLLESHQELLNFTAAFAAYHYDHGDDPLLADVLSGWKGLEHRYEKVIETSTLKVINDSKSTNVHSTICALNNALDNIILILGGKDKNQNFNQLALASIGKTQFVIVYGECAEQIYHAYKGLCRCVRVSGLEDAVSMALASSKHTSTILFSPACPSQDMFLDFEDRGRKFKQLILDRVA